MAIVTAAEKSIPTMVERIVRRFDPVQIILFGSYAHGEATDESDVDLLIVLSEVHDKRKAAVEIRRVLADLPVSKDIIVTTPGEIARRGHLVGMILRPALPLILQSCALAVVRGAVADVGPAAAHHLIDPAAQFRPGPAAAEQCLGVQARHHLHFDLEPPQR